MEKKQEWKCENCGKEFTKDLIWNEKSSGKSNKLIKCPKCNSIKIKPQK